jgi:hypothetical protein
MSAVAERVREQQRERLRAMTAEERVAEALALGQRAIETYASAHGVSREEARRRLERASQKGRRSSRVMAILIG